MTMNIPKLNDKQKDLVILLNIKPYGYYEDVIKQFLDINIQPEELYRFFHYLNKNNRILLYHNKALRDNNII